MKVYNGEKAIISLTSWKARINTVSKTIFSLLKMCPGFHIVLVLSEEEFPKKEAELPENLMMFVNANLIEILWVYKNTKSLKKILPTIEKYSDTPIISADDDCIYVCNYAEELYQIWSKNKSFPIAYRKSIYDYCCCGPATIYPPCIYKELIKYFKNNIGKHGVNDDGLIRSFLKEKNIHPMSITNKFPCYFHDEIKPINGSNRVSRWKNDQRYK